MSLFIDPPRLFISQNENSFNSDSTLTHSNSDKKAKPADKNFQMKFKTEICKNYRSGYCEFGDRCVFAHGERELRDKNEIAGKSKECKQYINMGYCINGSHCNYEHKLMSPKTASSSPTCSTFSSRKNSDEAFRSKLPIFIDLESRTCLSFN